MVIVKIPSWYKCGKCNISGVRLWREYQSSGELTCCKCMMKNITAYYVTRDGKFIEKGRDRRFATDSFAWKVPAVPYNNEEGSYWGYTSVSDDGVAWYKGLPLYNNEHNYIMKCERRKYIIIRKANHKNGKNRKTLKKRRRKKGNIRRRQNMIVSNKVISS